jgi:hypothetical protein
MKKIYSIILILHLACMAFAQQLDVYTTFNDTETTQINDLVIITSLNVELSGVTEDNGLLVSSELVPLLLAGEVTGIRDLEHIEGLSLFPNPVVSNATLQRQQHQDDYLVQIIGGNGTLLSLLHWNAGEESTEISLQPYASGIYIIRVMNEEGTEGSEFKVVKR